MSEPENWIRFAADAEEALNVARQVLIRVKQQLGIGDDLVEPDEEE
jgi:hypothetical protein